MAGAQPEYRLAPGQNLYDQPPFTGITQHVNNLYPALPEPGIRTHITLAANRIARSFVLQPSPDANQQLALARDSIRPSGGNQLSKWLTDRGYPSDFNNMVIEANRELMGRLALMPYWAVYVEVYASSLGHGKQYIVDGQPNPNFVPKKQPPPAEAYLSYLLKQVVRDRKLMYLGLDEVLPAGYSTETQALSSSRWEDELRRLWEERIRAVPVSKKGVRS